MLQEIGMESHCKEPGVAGYLITISKDVMTTMGQYCKSQLFYIKLAYNNLDVLPQRSTVE